LAATDSYPFQFTHWEGRLWLDGVTAGIVIRGGAGSPQIQSVALPGLEAV